MGSPPGFEGAPRYKHNVPKDKEAHEPTMTTYPYASIQTTCAKKLNIFLPVAGYTHIILEEDSVDKLYEMAYRNEFRRAPMPTPTSMGRHPYGNAQTERPNYGQYSARSN